MRVIPCKIWCGKRFALLFTFLFLAVFFPFHKSFPRASGPEWSEAMKKWLVALTYPDESPGDFGTPVTEGDRRLLERFKPKIIVSPEGLLPVDFYGFYLPRTVVRDLERGREVVKRAPSRGFLKGIERDRRYYLDYTGPLFPCEKPACRDYVATGYGRVLRETARFRTLKGIKEFPIIVLKYNFAFPFSGAPAELGFLKESFLRLFADPVRFHELDIHGSVQVILDKEKKPIILLLAEHNYFRSYVIGKDVPLPGDGRIPVCFAERSNEPYLCPAGAEPELHRTVGNPMYMSYVIGGGPAPITSGLDRVYGLKSWGRPVRYELKFLPARDPLYVSWIPLGDRKKILFFKTFYRNGPPGMDLNTHPELKLYGDMAQFWYLRDGSAEDASLMKRAFRSFTDVDVETVLEHNGARLYNDMLGAGIAGARQRGAQ